MKHVGHKGIGYIQNRWVGMVDNVIAEGRQSVPVQPAKSVAVLKMYGSLFCVCLT